MALQFEYQVLSDPFHVINRVRADVAHKDGVGFCRRCRQGWGGRFAAEYQQGGLERAKPSGDFVNANTKWRNNADKKRENIRMDEPLATWQADAVVGDRRE